jgi:hypothetical protein
MGWMRAVNWMGRYVDYLGVGYGLDEGCELDGSGLCVGCKWVWVRYRLDMDRRN